MNRRLGTRAVSLLALLAMPAVLAAEDHPVNHKHYTLVDLGPFGGPISPQGAVVGGVPTSVDDPNCLEVVWGDPSCHYVHAFKWRKGVLTDLGTLPGGNNSFAKSINSQGAVFGASENGLPDPVYGIRAFVATMWKNGEVQDLGTLGGGLSWPGVPGLSINDRGQAVGAAMNTSPDPDGYGAALIFGPGRRRRPGKPLACRPVAERNHSGPGNAGRRTRFLCSLRKPARPGGGALMDRFNSRRLFRSPNPPPFPLGERSDDRSR